MTFKDEPTASLTDNIKGHLIDSEYDVLDVIAIPSHSDRMIRIRTIEDAFEDFDSELDEDTTSFIIRIKKSGKTDKAPDQLFRPVNYKNGSDEVYLASGKLNTPFLVQNAKLLCEAGDYALARNIYQTILENRETSYASHLGCAICDEELGNYTDAIPHYEEAISFEPKLEVFRRLAKVMLKIERFEGAAEACERALTFSMANGDRLDLHLIAGDALLRADRNLKNIERAAQHFRQALELDAHCSSALHHLGEAYLKLNKIQEAKSWFSKAQQLEGESQETLSGLAQCALATGAKKEAYELFLRSIKIGEPRAALIFFLVKTAYEIKEYGETEKIVADFCDTTPVSANLLYSLAGLQFHLKKYKDSEKNLEKVLSIQKNHKGAMDLLQLIERTRK